MFRARLFRLAAAAAGAGGRRCSPRGPRCSERAKVQCSCSVQCAEWAAAVRRPGRDVRARARRARAAARRACACAHSPSPHSGLRPAAAATPDSVRGRSAGAVVWPQGGLLSTHTRTHRTPTALNGTSTLGYFGVLTVLSSLYVTHTRPRPATAPRWRSCCCRCLPSTRGQWGRASSQEQRALRLLSVLGYSQPQPPRPPHPPRPPQLAPPRSPPAP